MRHLLLNAALWALLALAGPLHAQTGDTTCTPTRDGRLVCPPPDARCVTTRLGDVVCSTPGGGIAFDRYGEAVCGPGNCATDIRGDLFCSSAPRGAASIDRYGNAACAEGCVPARASACGRPRPTN
jgi:hypothetical protein